MKTDEQKCIKEQKDTLFSNLSRNPTKSDRENVYCWCLG